VLLAAAVLVLFFILDAGDFGALFFLGFEALGALFGSAVLT
jgi:hypothetical protein